MTFNLKTATPDTTMVAGAVLFGADSQSATNPSVYPISNVIGYLSGSTSDPSPGATISTNSVVTITTANGGRHTYRALSEFTWVDLVTHVYGATRTLIPLHREQATAFVRPTPTGFAAPLIDVYQSRKGTRPQTAQDDLRDFRAAWMPTATVGARQKYYLDGTNGNDANSGYTKALAKKTWSSLKTKITTDAVTVATIYIVGMAGAYDRLSGPDHNGGINIDLAVIGIADSSGRRPIMGHLYVAADVTWTANGSYDWVYQTPTTSISSAGRICDIAAMETVVDSRGRTWRVPREYVAKTTVADVADTPGSYWFDSGGTTLYINTVSGGAPTLNTDVCIIRSNVDIAFQGTGHVGRRKFFMEGITLLGAIGGSASCYETWAALDCASWFSRTNAMNIDGSASAIARGCFGFRPTNDGISVHNTGANITAISQTNPVVVTATTHGRANGEQVLIAQAGSTSMGMTQIANLVFTVANRTSGTFELQGIDGTAYTAYAGTGLAKVREPTPKSMDIDCTIIAAGTAEGSNQSMTVHEHVEHVSVFPTLDAGWRNAVTNVGTSKHWIIGGSLSGTQPRTFSAGNPDQWVTAGGSAQVALDACELSGRGETVSGSPLLAATGSGQIRILDTDIPVNESGTTRWSGVTATW